MKEEIGRDSRIQLAIIENHLVELYQAAVNEQRTKILASLRQMIQEKDAQGDHVAVSVLDWTIDRLLRS
jgi:hypothetical protein